MRHVLIHILIVGLLTLLTQIGGVIWLLALVSRRVWLVFPALYLAASLVTPWLSERDPLPCFGDTPLVSQSLVYCVLNRHYVSPEMADVARDLAAAMAARHPTTQTRILDGNFPFFDGFPLLPHLSHDDGEKLDLAFYWASDGQYERGKSPSPLGYWGYARGPTDCPARWSDLRWDMDWLQDILPTMQLDRARMRTALNWLANDARISKVLIEPHVQQSVGLSHPKLRFQGCRAARHDDHIHIQL